MQFEVSNAYGQVSWKSDFYFFENVDHRPANKLTV